MGLPRFAIHKRIYTHTKQTKQTHAEITTRTHTHTQDGCERKFHDWCLFKWLIGPAREVARYFLVLARARMRKAGLAVSVVFVVVECKVMA